MFTIGTICFFVLLYFFLSWIRRLIRINSISDKYILITGCDSGFGKLLVQKLDVLGAHVFAACLTETGQVKLRQETSTRVKTLILDVTKDEHVRQAVLFVTSQIPEGTGLWGLVNNAGSDGAVLGPPDWHTVDDFSQVMDVNLLGTVRMTLALLPLLRQAQGRVVNVSGAVARLPSPMCLPYCVSKAALATFTDGIRQHLSQFGVSVHLLEPGSFQTPMTCVLSVRAKVERAWSEAHPAVKQLYGRQYYQILGDWMTSTVSHQSSPHLYKVIWAFTHALTARYPRMRYTLGWDAKLFYIPFSYAPSCIQDFICQWLMGNVIPNSSEERRSSESS